MRAVLSFLLLAAVLQAQDPRGALAGRVTDPSGAAIPGAEIRATNTSSGVAAVARTNSTGNYLVPYLIPGSYRVTVELAGFKTFLQASVQVRINETVTLDVPMQIGDVAEKLEVTAGTPLLGTADVSLGQVLDERRVSELPVASGNPFEHTLLVPGITNPANLTKTRASPFNANGSAYSSAGAGSYNNEFTIDGITNKVADGSTPRAAVAPPQTAVSDLTS